MVKYALEKWSNIQNLQNLHITLVLNLYLISYVFID